jgi:hypothetical protein
MGNFKVLTLASFPYIKLVAPDGNMTRVYNIGDIGEARSIIAFMKGCSNAYNMVGVSTAAAAGNIIAG